MEKLFSTERLYFRKFHANESDLIFDLNKDAEVTKYTYDPVISIQQASSILNESILPQYNRYNMGRWAVHLKNTNEFIGWCGLKFTPENNDIDLGYRFKKIYWGQGYATEAAKGSIDYGLYNLNLTCITGRAIPENIPSINVLKKCGMSYVGIQESHGHLCETYQIAQKNINL